MSEIQAGSKYIDVEQVKTDWALALMTKGVIVKLKVSRWRASAALQPDELGISFSDAKFIKKYVSLGREKLLPPVVERELNMVECQARTNLANYSYDTVWGKFVPYIAFDQWHANNESIKQDFYDCSKRLGERYDEVVAIVQEDYKSLANDVWKRLYPEGGNPTEGFVTNFTQKIIAKIPERHVIVSSFDYRVSYFFIPLPSFIEKDIAKAKQIERDQDVADEKVLCEISANKKISEEYISKKTELIDGFLNATVQSMRFQIAELCQSVLDSLNRNPDNNEVKSSHCEKINKMIDRVKFLNFYDDKEMTRLLVDLQKQVDKVRGERTKDIIVDRLDKIVRVSQKEYIPTDFNPSIGSLEL